MKSQITQISGLKAKVAGASQRAFTKIDLLVLLATVALLLSITLPALASNKQRSEQLVCVNNLRQIGRAFHLWANDHGDQMPCRVPVAEGGTQVFGKSANAWYDFGWISNQLVTPRFLVCPSDTSTRKIGSNWGADPDGGFLNINYRGNALSYFVGLDTHPALPSSLLAGDHNLSLFARNVTCSSGINNAATLYALGQPAAPRWLPEVHINSGNLLFMDGRVLEVSNENLQAHLQGGDDNGQIHVLLPR